MTKLYDPETGEELDLLKSISNMNLQNGSFMVYIGKKARLKVRLIYRRVPEEVAKKRRYEAKKIAKKRGYTPKKETLALHDWSIYITNVPDEMANEKQVVLLYTVRWQIELFFRLCKSEAQIDKTLGKKSGRIMCELYAKMISIIVLLQITGLIPAGEETEVSHNKAYKRVGLYANNFFESLISAKLFKNFLVTIVKSLEKRGVKDLRRKKRKSTHQKLIETEFQEVTS